MIFVVYKRKRHFLIFIALLEILLYVRDYGALVNSYNSSMLALSYRYGLISRGLSGTIFQLINQITPFNMMSYTWVLRYTFALTTAFYCFLFLFFVFLVKKSTDENYELIQCQILLITVFVVTYFACQHNFGRVDIFMTGIAILCLLLLLWEKFEWLIIPLSVIAVMFHQGYVFMLFNVTLVILIYKFLSSEGKKKRKYAVIFILSFVFASIAFLYFNFFAHTSDISVYKEVVANAKKISEPSEGYHKGLLQHEILGIDPTESEVLYHLRNFVEFPIFVVFMLPYIIVLIKFYKGILNAVTEVRDKIKYIFMMIGILTIVPNMLLKVDYGRWMFSVIVYFLLTLTYMFVSKDTIAIAVFKNQIAKIKQSPWMILLLVLPLLITPLWDVNICRLSAHLGGDINNHFLHLWVD